MRKEVMLIGAALGWGARWPETELGPKTLKDSGLLEALAITESIYLQSTPSALSGEKKPYAERLVIISDLIYQIADQTEKAIQAKKIPVVMGGDHAIAIGTWQGVKAGLNATKLGLLWIDAHLDAHTPETSMSHNIHGMPVAALLGFGEKGLIAVKGKAPTLYPQHIAMVGVRSADPGETELIQSLGVRVFSMNEIEERGIKDVMIEAHKIVTAGTDGFGMSIDLDGFDPQFAPGTGSPELNGLDPNNLVPLLADLGKDPLFCGLEIAEFNPTRDQGEITLKLVGQLLKSILA